MAAGVYTACEYSYIYIYILYVLNTEYETERNPVTPLMGHQVSDLFSAPAPTFDFALLVFLAEFYAP